MRYNLVSVKACLDHLGSSIGSDLPRWFSSLAASLILDTSFPWGLVGLGLSVGFGRGSSASFTSFVPSSFPFFPSNEDYTVEDAFCNFSSCAHHQYIKGNID